MMAEKLAQDFHETYERLAPEFGYETRRESAKPWAEVPDANRKLMIAVCTELLRRLEHGQGAQRYELHLPVTAILAALGALPDGSSYQMRWDAVEKSLRDHLSVGIYEDAELSPENKQFLNSVIKPAWERAKAKQPAPPEQPQGSEPTFCSDPDCNTCKAEKEKLNEQSAGLADRGDGHSPYCDSIGLGECDCGANSKPADPAQGQQFPNEASFAKMQELVTRAAQPQMSARGWWQANRDNFVNGFSGSGLATRSEYDIPAALEAFARSRVSAREHDDKLINRIYRETQDDHAGCLGNRMAIIDFAKRYAEAFAGAAPSLPSAEELARKMYERRFGVARQWKDALSDAQYIWIDRARECLAAISALSTKF